MINNVEKQCVGCGACSNICPVGAIKIAFNEKGFYAPFVDEKSCIKCGKCLKVCSAIEYKTQNLLPETYMVTASDSERDKSTSGGAFGVLAKYVLENNGYVCGVAFNENWEAEHIIINRIGDLDRLRVSKYVQSTTANCFSSIKKLLDNGQTVLFSGTPCQNAGLLKFLNKDYKNLITIDLLCHGSPSPKVWQDYLEKNFNKSQITDICFRKKNNDWQKGTWPAIHNINNGYVKEGNEKKEIGIYYEAFLRHVLSNDACMECKYKFIPRPADFTIGDFWSWKKYNSKIDPQKGLSVLLANNAKAVDLLKKIKGNFQFIRSVDLKENWQDIEINHNSKATLARSKFFEKYRQGEDINKAMSEAIGQHYDVGMISFFNVMNYGSAIVAYAANKIIENLGYSVLMINKDFNGFDADNLNNRSMEFAKKYYNISKFYESKDSVCELNSLCDTFVVASDTMWWDSEYAVDFAWLDFALSDKKKISFCTSFAHKVPAMDDSAKIRRRFLYKRFHALSVREQSGVDILKNMFDVEGTHLYDPTLIADKKIFDDLAEKSKRTEKGFIFAYMLDLTPEKERVVKYVADKLNLKLKLVSNMRYKGGSPLIDENNISIEDFLYFCKNAEFIMSDSFHGTCFSTIFEKPFISIINAWRGLERYQIFMDNGLGNHLVSCVDDIYHIDLNNFKPDYRLFKKKIASEKLKAIKWLKNALEKQVSLPTKEDLLYDYIYNSNINNNVNKNEYIKEKTLLEKVFSVKNESIKGKKRKIITILGIKIKMKKRK